MGVTISVKRKKDSRLKKILNNFLKRGPEEVVVGFPMGKTSGSVIERAIFNEFGTRGSGKGFSTHRGGGFGGPIPERPFMRNAMRSNKSKYSQAMKKSAKKILMGETSLATTLEKLGALAASDIQDEIQALKSPPNSPTTIAIKGSSNPLIDTGQMRQSVTWETR